MEDYGSDFITITDEDGTEYDLEVLAQVEYQGKTYYAVTPALAEGEEEDEDAELEISILREDEEDGEPFLSAIDDENELNTVYDLVMDTLYEEEDEE